MEILKHFDTAFSAPDGIKKLRELIITLAMQGKLVPQDPNDQPASELLKEIEAEKQKLIKENKIKKQKELPPIKLDEIPYDIPSSWKWVRLNDIGEINPRNNETDDNIEVGFVPMPMINAEYGMPHIYEVKKWGSVKKAYTHFAEGDIGLAKITPCFENGKSCVFKNLPNGIGAGTTELHVFRNTFNVVFPDFLLCYIKDRRYITNGIPKMTGSAGQKRIPKDYFAHNPFPLPPIAEQKRIVKKIDQLMAMCDEMEKFYNAKGSKRLDVHKSVIHQLLNAENEPEFVSAWSFIKEHFSELYSVKENVIELRKAVLQLGMQGKLAPQDPSDQSASELLKEIETEKLKLIQAENLKTKASETVSAEDEHLGKPNGWEYCRIGNLAKFIDYRGRTPKKVDKGTPLITAKNVRFGFINREPYEFIEDSDYDAWMTRGFPRIGDILFTTEAPLGNVAIIDIEEKFALAQRVLCMQFHHKEISPFLRLLFMSQGFQELLKDNSTGMTAKGIKSAKLKEIAIPLPPLAEQKRIVEKIDQLMAMCDELETQIDKAEETQTALLNSVMATV